MPPQKPQLTAKQYFDVGLQYVQKKEYDKAAVLLHKAALLTPDWLEPYFTLAHIYAIQKNYDSAIDVTKRILKKHPTNADAQYNLGELYTAIKRYTDAIAAYEQALKLNTTKKDRIMKILPQLKKLAGTEPQTITFSTHHHVS